MTKSPALKALQISAAFGLLSISWIIFDHFGPRHLMSIDNDPVLQDVPADAIFAVLSSLILFFVVRHYLIAQERVHAALRRANDVLEVRVQERTADLDAERKKLQLILDTMPDGVCIIDQNHEVAYVNPAMQRAWGPVAGRKCYAYFGDRDLPCPHCRRPQIIAGQMLTWEWNTDDGAKTYEVVGSALYNLEGATATLYIFHDVTAQVHARHKIENMGKRSARQAEELRLAHTQLSSRARELAALLDISRTMASTLESQPLLAVILDQIKTMIDYHSAILYVLDGDGITAVSYRGPLSEEQVVGLHVALDAAPACRVLLERGEPVIVDDIHDDNPLAQSIAAVAHTYFSHRMASTHAWMAVPLMANDRVLGLLRLDHTQAGHFTKHEADIAMAIANQAAVALENSRLYEEAHKVAVLEERQRMARDLHDSVSQALYGIALGTHAAREQLERAPEKLHGTLDYVLAMSATAVAEMRALVFELRPDSLEQEGLGAALTKQADALRARTGAVVNVEVCEEPPLSSDGKEVLYRIAQEAMQNIVKHAQAANVNLRLYQQNGWATLEVCDDGIGFEPAGRYPGHYGLKTMRERALRLSGTLDIDSKPHTGSVVRARIPVTNRVAA